MLMGLVASGADAGGAKVAAKGRATYGEAFGAITHDGKAGTAYVAGSGIDKILGPAAFTLLRSAPAPTSTPGVFRVRLKPMILWLRKGTMSGTATLLLNGSTGQFTGNATFVGATGAYKRHTLVVTGIKGTADLAKGRFHYKYAGIYK
jgi:hypothetical protein